MLLQETPNGGLRLDGLKIKVSMGLTAVTDLKHKTSRGTARLRGERERHRSNLGLEVVLLLEVLEGNTANVLGHLEERNVLPCRALMIPFFYKVDFLINLETAILLANGL